MVTGLIMMTFIDSLVMLLLLYQITVNALPELNDAQALETYLTQIPMDLMDLKQMISNITDDSFDTEYPHITSVILNYKHDLRYQFIVNDLMETLVYNNTGLTNQTKRYRLSLKLSFSKRIFEANEHYFGELSEIARSIIILPSQSQNVSNERCLKLANTLLRIYTIYDWNDPLDPHKKKMKRFRRFLLMNVMQKRLKCKDSYYKYILDKLSKRTHGYNVNRDPVKLYVRDLSALQIASKLKP